MQLPSRRDNFFPPHTRSKKKYRDREGIDLEITRVMGWQARFRFPFLSTASEPTLGTTQPSSQWTLGEGLVPRW
jgi:hypothetical protein